MPKLTIITFGCQANELDSARIAGLLAGEGYELTADETSADLVILNGCSIRDKAAQKLFSRLGTLRALKAQRPGMRLGVAGCLAQHEGAALCERFPFVDLVVGNGEQLAELPRLLAAGSARALAALGEPTGFFPDEVEIPRDSAVRAWVGIMEGCDRCCSFCVVPQTRGRERSRRPEDILREVRNLVARGFREITLLGQTVDSYGKKLTPALSFPDLLAAIDAVVGPRVRVRFTTSHPLDVTPELADAMARLRSVCEHMHLPVQAGADRILAAMRRGYPAAAYLERVAMLRERVPGIALTTDLIAGFPGETEPEFAETLALMERVRFDGAFAFTYSPRAGTAAAALPDQVPDAVKAERLQRILALQKRHSLLINRAQVGRTVEVLVDDSLRKRDTPLRAGRTRRNTIVHFEGGADLPEGALANVEILDSTAHHLKGVLIASS
jgi:tRNA-2-methylthio-N6-dimethylallyladenosine synthase